MIARWVICETYLSIVSIGLRKRLCLLSRDIRAAPAGMKMATLVVPDHSGFSRETERSASRANHFAALNGLFPLAASKAR